MGKMFKNTYWFYLWISHEKFQWKKGKIGCPSYHHFSLSSLFYLDHRFWSLGEACQTLLLTHILLLGFYPAWDSCRVSVGECRPCRGPVELFLQHVGVCRVNPLVVVLFCVDNVESEVLVKVDGALVVNLAKCKNLYGPEKIIWAKSCIFEEVNK